MSDAPQPTGVDAQEVIGDKAAPTSQADIDKQQAVEEFSKMEENGQLSMRVKVHSPFRDYYDGQAFSISAENTTGPFDILPKHHSFISLLAPCDLIVRTVQRGDQTIRISGGIMHVKADRVVVFLDV